MARNADNGTYIYIPPPPLPQFYTPNNNNDAEGANSLVPSKNKDAAITSKTPPITMDGAYDGQPTFVPYPPPLMAMPSDFRNALGYDIPPLAIYHICRVCLRTRSARYHREHPIPIDGMPPPPGICRRCRVASIEELQRVTNVIVEGESNNIKLGFIAPFVPDEAIISNDEFRQMRVDEFMNQLGEEELEDLKLERRERRKSRKNRRRRQDIKYRYVDPVDDADPPARTRKTKVTFYDEQSSASSSDEQEASSSPPRRSAETTTTSMQVQPTENPPTISKRKSRRQSYKVSGGQIRSKSSSRSSSASSSDSTIKASGQVARRRTAQLTDTSIREIAREEVQRYHEEHPCPDQRPDLIRAIARDGIERYRRAERILEAHPDPYAHGRMVPVQRRIVRERDVIEKKPWVEFDRKEKVSMSSGYPTVSVSVRRSESPSGRYVSPTEKDDEAWPKNTVPSSRRSHREPSPERHESQSSRESVKSIERVRGQRKSHDVKLEQTYESIGTKPPERHKQSSRPISSASAPRFEPSLSRSTRQGPRRMDDIVEVVEEWEESAERPVEPAKSQTPTSSRQYQRWWSDSRYVENSTAGAGNAGLREEDRASTERPASRASQHQSSYRRPADSEEWGALSRVRTLESRSSKFYETSGSGGTPQESARESNRQSEPASMSRAQSHRSEAQANTSDDKTVWPGSEPVPSKSSHQTSQRPVSSLQRADSPKGRKTHPANAREERSARSIQSNSRTSRNDNSEYVHTERVIKPLDELNDLPYFHGLPQPRRVEVEEWVETRKYPASDRGRDTSKDDGERVSRHDHESLKRQMPEDLASSAERSHKNRFKHSSKQSASHHGRQAGPERDQDDHGHVRFSNKVDYSPTPPDSDDSSSAFRSYSSIGRRGAGRNVDGVNSPVERRTEMIREVETRGRTASRTSTRRDAPSRGQDSVQSRSVKSSGGKMDGRASAQDHRPLRGALSESPSRERSVSSADGDDEQDGRGPYRELQKPSDSMQVEDGRRRGGRESVNRW